MSAPDPLAKIWTCADAQQTQFSAAEVASWPEGHEEMLTASGVLRRDDNATTVVCDACHGGHIEEVVFIESPPGSAIRAYVFCPEAGRVGIPLDMLKQWVVDFDGLARAAASGLELAGQVEEIVRTRLWLLGTTTIAGRSREVFLARGITWTDAPVVFGRCERLNTSKGALFLLAGDLPYENIWTDAPPSAVPLKTVMRFDRRVLTIDRDHLEAFLTRDRRKPPFRAQKTFPTPPGTQWHEVMVWVSDLHITIEAKRSRREFTFQEAGFEEKRRRGVPDLIWGLLKAIAMRGGVIPYDGAGLDRNMRANLKQYVTVLRKRLRAAIPGIGGDPVPHDRHERCYRTAFKIASQEGLTFPVPDGTKWPNVTITLTRSGAIRISVPAVERYAASTYTEEADGDVHHWEAAERESEREREYDFRMLRLADHNGRSNAMGDALIEVLRANGVVARPAGDEVMLELCGMLTKLMAGVEGSPFDFASGSQKWVALFRTFCERPIDPLTPAFNRK